MSRASWFGIAVVVGILIIVAFAVVRWPKVRGARKGLSDLAARHGKEVPRAQ